MKQLVLILCIAIGVQASWPLRSNDQDYYENDDSDFPSAPRIPVQRQRNVPKVWWNSKPDSREGKSWWWGVDDHGQQAGSSWWGNTKEKSWWAVPTRQTFDVCRVSNNKVETVNGIRYTYPDTTCHTTLIRDCASEPTFSVSLKRVHKNRDHWVMRIVTLDNTIQLKREKDNDNNWVKIYLNDKLYNGKNILEVIENDVTVSRVVRQDEFTTVTLPLVGVQIAFDGFNVVMRIDKSHSSQFCGGICNHVDFDENVIPIGESVEREITEQFHRRYVSDKECEFL